MKRKRENNRKEEENKRLIEDEKKKKIRKEKEKRKKLEKKNWFAELASATESDSDEWTSVNRVEKSKIRKQKMKKHRELKVRDVYDKANHMIGVCPIGQRAIDYHNKKTNNYEDAKIEAIKDFLGYHLKFTRDVLE